MLDASFFGLVGIYDGWFNQAAVWMTGGPYCHSKLVFKWTKAELEEVMQLVKGHLPLCKKFEGGIYVCLYVLRCGMVDYQFLSEDSPSEFFGLSDHMIEMNVTKDQEHKLIQWLFDQYSAPYNRVGAVLCPFHWRNPKQAYNWYFCLQLMACGTCRSQYDHTYLVPQLSDCWVPALRDDQAGRAGSVHASAARQPRGQSARVQGRPAHLGHPLHVK
eukprot:14137191-Ditylum_brightwellii.AAC.1